MYALISFSFEDLMAVFVSAAPYAQCSRFSTVIDHDLIVCGRFLPGEASRRQDNVLYLIYNKQGSAPASNWWGKASFHSRIVLSSAAALLFHLLVVHPEPRSDLRVRFPASRLSSFDAKSTFRACFFSCGVSTPVELNSCTQVDVYNSLIVANIVAFVIQTATWLTARVLLQACYIRCMCIPSTVHGESGTVV